MGTSPFAVPLFSVETRHFSFSRLDSNYSRRAAYTLRQLQTEAIRRTTTVCNRHVNFSSSSHLVHTGTSTFRALPMELPHEHLMQRATSAPPMAEHVGDPPRCDNTMRRPFPHAHMKNYACSLPTRSSTPPPPLFLSPICQLRAARSTTPTGGAQPGGRLHVRRRWLGALPPDGAQQNQP